MSYQDSSLSGLAQVLETLNILRADQEALCALLVEGGIVSAQTADHEDCATSVELFDTRSYRSEAMHPPSSRGRLYVCGGRNAASADCFGPLQKTWRSLNPMARAAAAVVGDHLHVCGGSNGRLLGPTERLDTSSEVWEVFPAMSQGRYDAGTAVIRDRIYVVGGVVPVDG